MKDKCYLIFGNLDFFIIDDLKNVNSVVWFWRKLSDATWLKKYANMLLFGLYNCCMIWRKMDMNAVRFRNILMLLFGLYKPLLMLFDLDKLHRNAV